MYITDYKKNLEWLKGKILREESYDSAQILAGEDIITTFRGYEAVRHRPDNSIQVTVPKYRGMRWLRLFGAYYGICHTRKTEWNGHIEGHFVLKLNSGEKILTTGKFEVQAKEKPGSSWGEHIATKPVVDYDWRPRKKVLTARGKEQLEEYIKTTFNKAAHEFAVAKLKNTPIRDHSKFTCDSLMHNLEAAGKPTLATANNYWGYQNLDQLKRVMNRARYRIAEMIGAEIEYLT